MKYYYYVAIITKRGKTSYTHGTVKTETDDFPLLETENKLSEYYAIEPNDVVITFYKEITENTYKTYNNEQQD